MKITTSQLIVTVGLIGAACTAKSGGFNRKQAVDALRASVKRNELPISNKSVRDAVACVYREGGAK